MTDGQRQALQRYLDAERELEDARWALMAAINASYEPRSARRAAPLVDPPCARSDAERDFAA
jgi:hypothetical protein